MSNNSNDNQGEKKMTKEETLEWIRQQECEIQTIFADMYGKPLRDMCEWEDTQGQQAQDREED